MLDYSFDLLKGPIATADLVVAHDGFTAGAELGYDISSLKSINILLVLVTLT